MPSFGRPRRCNGCTVVSPIYALKSSLWVVDTKRSRGVIAACKCCEEDRQFLVVVEGWEFVFKIESIICTSLVCALQQQYSICVRMSVSLCRTRCLVGLLFLGGGSRSSRGGFQVALQECS